MEKEIRQILKNQQGIMNTINHIVVRTCVEDSGDFQRHLIECYESTKELLNPKQSNEPCCDMEEEEKGIGCGDKFVGDNGTTICGTKCKEGIELCFHCKEKFAKRGLEE